MQNEMMKRKVSNDFFLTNKGWTFKKEMDFCCRHFWVSSWKWDLNYGDIKFMLLLAFSAKRILCKWIVHFGNYCSVNNFGWLFKKKKKMFAKPKHQKTVRIMLIQLIFSTISCELLYNNWSSWLDWMGLYEIL
jgi:hypothetical protein